MKSFIKYFTTIILFSIFVLLSLKAYAYNISKDLEDTFFRIHIIANSNSTEDQKIKLYIRDAIIEYLTPIIKENNFNKEETINYCIQNVEKLKEITKSTLIVHNSDQKFDIQISNEYFPSKFYHNISMPSGYYDALLIKLGNSSGDNWWCSLFPPLCFIDISNGYIDDNYTSYLKENLTEEEFNIITSSSPSIKYKFKLVELFNN